MKNDIIEFIETAVKMERNNQLKYREMAAKAEDPEIRAVFEQLARDEEAHEKALKDALVAIKLMKGLE